MAGYLRRHHVGLLALFVALGGTAFAVTTAPKNSVVSKSIRANAVRSADVKDGAVQPRDLGLARTISIDGPLAITAENPASVLASTDVRLGPTGLVSIFVRGELRKTTGTACLVHARLSQADGPAEDTLVIYEDANSPDYSRVQSSPAPESPDRIGRGIGGWVVLRSAPGVRTLSLRLARFSASCLHRSFSLVAVPVS